MTKLKSRIIRPCLVTGVVVLLYACGATNPPEPSQGHIKPDSASKKQNIPKTVSQAPLLPPPGKREKLETYTVVVNEVPIKELLFSMARDAKINLDIDDNITGKITMNAIDQTLPKILDRIEAQSDITYELTGDTLVVQADKPVLRTYKVNYLNIVRTSGGNVSVSTEIGSTGSGISQSGSGNSTSGSSSGGKNKASSEIKNESVNQFWATLSQNIASILGEDEKSSQGSNTGLQQSKNIIVNRESGLIAVRATAKQHRIIKKFIEQVVGNVQRQVLIEATIAEVYLSDLYQAGIDWSVVSETALDSSGQTVLTKGGEQSVIGGNLGSSPFFQLATSGKVNGNPLNITLKALETFGDVKVMSSPKVMALNNQTAILKVVDNQVYFTTDVEVNAGTVNQNSTTVVNTNVNTIPIGIVMAVTPYIDDNDEVTLNVRPTVSRVNRYVNDPNPLLAESGVTSAIPVVQVREIETMLKVDDGETAVLGGLMEDTINKDNRGVPILSSIPLIGSLFSYTEEQYEKTELVIFIRPVVVENASLDGDLADYKKYLLEDLQQNTAEKLSDQ
jgi:general secretion pathway protein D